MSNDKNVFVVAYLGNRIIFRINAKTPDGNDGVGRLYYYFLDGNGEFREGKTDFGVNNVSMKSGTVLSLKFLREAWQELDEGGWTHVPSEEQFFSETIK